MSPSNTIQCWSGEDGSEHDVPDYEYTDYDVGGSYACGIVKGGATVCWGDSSNTYGEFNSP